MKTCVKLIFVALVVLAGSSFATSTSQSVPNNREKRLQKYKIKKALGEKVISWLSDANDAAGAECDRLADSLLALKEPGVWSYFIAAQVANLREKPKKAIAILEEVIGKHPNEKAPATTLPVRIVARFWIGTIARYSGDIAKANNVYEKILENLQGVKAKVRLGIICNLYLAEIEYEHLKRNDLALARLEAIERVRKPAGPFGAGCDTYRGWATYQRIKISKGRSQAAQELVAYPEMVQAPLLAGHQLSLGGLSGAPLTGCGSDTRINIVVETLAIRTVGNTASPIDRELMRLFYYGFGHEGKKEFGEAEKHYSALLEGDSYFSPVAGISLAHCKKAQDKTTEADSILEQVRTKYPGYNSLVSELKESWKKQTR